VFIFDFLVRLFLVTQKKKAGFIVRRRWLNRLPSSMGLQLDVYGTPTKEPALIVCKHISYVDPIVVLLHVEAQVVAKAEVKQWPLVGFGAHLVGTIFVKREEKSSRQETADTIKIALMNKESILVFPEGTTTGGPGTLPFKPRSFSTAHHAGIPVQPVAIYYDSPFAAFIGDDTFLPHFFRLFRLKKISGRLSFGPLLYGEDTAAQAEQWINREQLSYQHSLKKDG
jgi:1-acyl-sn-glycerol-3-phosphate acyltransferase